MTEWTTIQDETPDKIIFDTFGDCFTGVFQGIQEITPEDADAFEQAVFRNDEGLYAIGGYKVLNAMRDVPQGTLTRLTYVKNVDTGQPSPMKDVKVETAR